MARIKQKILTIDIVNIAIVGVSPLWWPGINQNKRVAAVLEAWPALHDLGPMHGEVMLSSEPGAKAVIGDAPSAAGVASLILLPTSLLPTRLLPAFFWPSRFLPSRFLTTIFWTSRFLSTGFRSSCFLPTRFLLAWPHFPTRLRFLLSLFLLIRSRGPGFILPRTVHFILSG
jgi:hypothetical protein